MCTTYNTKKAFRSLSQVMQKAIFEKLAPELEIDWTKVKVRNVDHLYSQFLTLCDELRGKVDSALYEIFVFAEHPNNATTLHSLIGQQGLVPPADFDEWSIHDKAAWVYLQDETAWTQAARFAHIDRMAESLWFVQKLYNGGAGKVERSLPGGPEGFRSRRASLFRSPRTFRETGRKQRSRVSEETRLWWTVQDSNL